jgi:succinate dehydrogenase hydrophobic anchor subunit
MDGCTTLDILRTFTIFGMTLFDLTMTFLVAILFSCMIVYSYFITKTITNDMPQKFIFNTITFFLLLLNVGVFVHAYLGIPTMLNYYLGINTYQSVIDNRNHCWLYFLFDVPL